MPTSVVSAWLATASPPSGTVPSRPTMAESASRNSGSATSAPNAGTASRSISRSCAFHRAAVRRRGRRAWPEANEGGMHRMLGTSNNYLQLVCS